jgi:uncharacterized protein with HEPN domain
MALVSKRDCEQKMPDTKAFLRFALEAVQRIESYVQGLSYDKFSLDRMRQDAVLFRLKILGRILTELLRELESENSVQAIARYEHLCKEIGQDNRSLNLQLVWDTVTIELAHLREQLLALQVE